MTGDTLYHTNHSSNMVSLGIGKHEIVVMYSTPGKFIINDIEDY